jgi:hypothetical protein
MIRRPWEGVRFLVINLWCTRSLPNAPAITLMTDKGRLTVRTVTARDIEQFERLHNEMRPEKPLSR